MGSKNIQKKKIIIVNKNFSVGGIQSSMINMANTLSDYYDVYLFLYHPDGTLKNKLNNKIQIIEPNWMFDALGMSLRECIKNGSSKQRIFRIFATIWTRALSNRFPISLAIKKQVHLGKYDYAIAYHHEFNKKQTTSGFNRVVTKLIDSNHKASWIHVDLLSNQKSIKFNEKYYKKMDRIVCVSKSVKKNFESVYPNINQDKIRVCHNFLDFSTIEKLYNEEPAVKIDKHNLVLFSTCRLVKVKGIPRAINAFSDTIKRNDVVWYIAGDGPEKSLIEKTIEENKLQNKIFLMGELKNPYCYYKKIDAVVLCSYNEAAPMLYTEAIYFKKPIFTTNISSSKEMLNNNKFGFICKNNIEGIKNGFKDFVENDSIRKQIANNLKNSRTDQNKMIREFEKVFN